MTTKVSCPDLRIKNTYVAQLNSKSNQIASPSGPSCSDIQKPWHRQCLMQWLQQIISSRIALCISVKTRSSKPEIQTDTHLKTNTLTCAVVAATSMQKKTSACTWLYQVRASCRSPHSSTPCDTLSWHPKRHPLSSSWGKRQDPGPVTLAWPRSWTYSVPKSTLHTARLHCRGWRPSWWIHGKTVPCPSISSAWSSCLPTIWCLAHALGKAQLGPCHRTCSWGTNSCHSNPLDSVESSMGFPKGDLGTMAVRRPQEYIPNPKSGIRSGGFSLVRFCKLVCLPCEVWNRC